MSSRTRWAGQLTALLLALLLVLYLSAKIHFFSRFDPYNLRGYVVEHSAFWISMAVIAVVIWLIAYFGEKQAREESGNR